MNALSQRSLLRQTYIKSMDKDFVAATIQAIGRCATNIGEVRDTCLNGLVQLLSNRDGESLPFPPPSFSLQLRNSRIKKQDSQKTQGFRTGFSRRGFLAFPCCWFTRSPSVLYSRSEQRKIWESWWSLLMEADKSETKHRSAARI